jgi:hypothetical protein
MLPRRMYFVSFLLVSFAQSAHAVEKAEPFPGLKLFEIKGYITARIWYDPEISQVVNKPVNPEGAETGEPLVTRVLRMRLDRTRPEEYFVDFDEGPSVDPEIVLTRVGAAEPAGYASGLTFYLPGNGAIYAAGHTNNMFDARTKMVVRDGKLVEVPQPSYWVGLESKALKDLTLTSAKGKGEVIARISKGGTITVLLNEGEWYLLKTPFGLVGWVHIPGGSQEADTIEGLFFAGD